VNNEGAAAIAVARLWRNLSVIDNEALAVAIEISMAL
jgi:hypothetical protein